MSRDRGSSPPTKADGQSTGAVDALFVAPKSGAPPESRDAIAIRTNGIKGDRYRLGEGYFQLDACPVTLVAAEAIEAIRAETGIDVSDGRHRRNIVIEGFGTGMDGLLETTVAVGHALLQPTRRRPPCAHVEELAGADGLATALKHRGGLCCDVIDPGVVSVGDSVAIRKADPRTMGASIADRLRNQSDARPTREPSEETDSDDRSHER